MLNGPVLCPPAPFFPQFKILMDMYHSNILCYLFIRMYCLLLACHLSACQNVNSVFLLLLITNVTKYLEKCQRIIGAQ